LAHMQPQRDGFVVPSARRSAVPGRHLLVLDDTYVSGARAQSAAAALRRAGAASVQIVAAGRVLRPDRVPAHADFLRRQTLGATSGPVEPACRRCAQTSAPSE
jgi:adenine/guanine phosphoribosyltransferase-like PRPP-binding protein